jgi:hypothetical protein
MPTPLNIQRWYSLAKKVHFSRSTITFYSSSIRSVHELPSGLSWVSPVFQMCMVREHSNSSSITDLHIRGYPFVSRFASLDICFGLTPWSRVHLEKLTGAQLLKKFAAFYGTLWFITVFTSAHHRSLSWVRWIQSTSSNSISRGSHLRLGLPSGIYPSGYPTRILYAFLISPCALHAPPPEPSWFIRPNRDIWLYVD